MFKLPYIIKLSTNFKMSYGRFRVQIYTNLQIEIY